MEKDQNKTDLQIALQQPVTPRQRMDRIMAESIVAETKPVERRWYVSFLRTTLVSLGLTMAGYAFGMVLVAIAHYTGLEAWMDSMHSS
jgi:hypothetical protein